MSRGGILAAALLAGATLLAFGGASANPRMPPPRWKASAGPPTQMDVWLRRLVGRFRFEGLVEVIYYDDHRCAPPPPDPAQVENPPPPPVPYCQGIKGIGDCAGFGEGPGVQCILNVAWQDMYEVVYPTPESARAGVFNLPGGVSNLGPAMALFGLDPGGAGLRYQLVDNKGLAEGASGGLTGNRAIFKTACANAPALFNSMFLERIDGRPLKTCERTFRIDAKPDARTLRMSIDIEINDEMFTRVEMTLHRVPQTGK